MEIWTDHVGRGVLSDVGDYFVGAVKPSHRSVEQQITT